MAKFNGERVRVLIINCYLDETRRLRGRPHFVPQSVGPAYLAGAFNRDLVDVRVYSELHGGPFGDRDLMGWPDMLVLSGMTSCYDRMLHLAAYVRTQKPGVIVVAGGPGVRQLPRFSGQYFDYCCSGDIEELQEVVRETFGARYIAETMLPRFDLIKKWMGYIGYVESSRNCNFKCAFCTLTGERVPYQVYDADYIRKQIEDVGYHTCLLFVDNNFYGNNRAYFLEKLALLKELWKKKKFGGWAALVTNDFFNRDENLQLAKESGCMGLFSGVESFSADQLKRFNKNQNLILPQFSTIRKCLEAGIVFHYGVIFDPTNRSLQEIREEISLITGSPQITLPAFMNLTIPILRTPYFYECLEQGQLLPHTKLRDMDGNTVVLKTQDPVEEVVQFLKEMPTLQGYKRRVMRHILGFYRRYRRNLNLPQMISAVGNGALLCLPSVAHNHTGVFNRTPRHPPRTYITTTEPLGPLYTPSFPVEAKYAHYFQPTMITDASGALADPVVEDLMETAPGNFAPATATAPA